MEGSVIIYIEKGKGEQKIPNDASGLDVVVRNYDFVLNHVPPTFSLEDD